MYSIIQEALSLQLVLSIFACIIIGYFIGCISPAYIVGLIKGYDVRSSGSKNAGASNTVIMAGKLAGLFVAIFDILKATASWKLACMLFPSIRVAGIVGGVACIIGHMFPVFLHFRGGKGFACMGGAALAYSPRAFLIMFVVALIIALVTNYVAVSTAAMSIIWPSYYAFLTRFWLGAAILALPALPIILKHMENFRRIREGTELRMSYLWRKDKELARAGYEDAE